MLNYPHEWNTNLSQVTLDYEQSILFIEVQFKKIDKKKIDVGTLCSKKWGVRKEKSSTSIIYSQNFDQNGFFLLLF